MRQVVGTEHGVDLHARRRRAGAPVTPARGPARRTRPRSTWSPAPGRPARRRGRTHASRCPRAATRRTRVHADAASGSAASARIVPHPTTVVGEGGRNPLHTMDRRTLPGQRGQHRGPGPTRRSCSSAARRAKLRPRSASAAVSVRALVSCTTPMPCQPVSSRRRPRNAAQGRRPGPAHSAGRPAHRDRQPLVPGPARHRHRGQRAIEHQDADRRGHARRVGLPAQRQHAEEEADGHGDDLPGPPAGDPAAALTWTEAVALTRLPAHAPSSGFWPGGQAGGSAPELRAVFVVAHVLAHLAGHRRPDEVCDLPAPPPTSRRPRVRSGPAAPTAWAVAEPAPAGACRGRGASATAVVGTSVAALLVVRLPPDDRLGSPGPRRRRRPPTRQDLRDDPRRLGLPTACRRGPGTAHPLSRLAFARASASCSSSLAPPPDAPSAAASSRALPSDCRPSAERVLRRRSGHPGHGAGARAGAGPRDGRPRPPRRRGSSAGWQRGRRWR